MVDKVNRWTAKEDAYLQGHLELAGEDCNITKLASEIYEEFENPIHNTRTLNAIRVRLNRLVDKARPSVKNGQSLEESKANEDPTEKLSDKIRSSVYRLLELAEELDSIITEVEDIEDWLEKTFTLRDKYTYKVENTGVVEEVKRVVLDEDH